MLMEMPPKLFDVTEEIIGLVDGVFDLMHVGHIMHLNNCKKLCDILIVAIADDKFASRKGSDRPYVNEELRLLSIESLRCVDLAILCDGSVNIVNQIQPDIYFKNLDYKLDPEIDSNIYIQRMPVYYSTTRLVEYIRTK